MGGTFFKPGESPNKKVPSDLKIIQFNTQGFQNKVESINRFVRAHKPDILVVTEHFQKSDQDLEQIAGYNIVNSFCRQHSERGGVAIWARNDLPCHPRRDLDRHRKERQFEVVSVGVGLGGDLVVTGAYRPPDTTLSDFHRNLDALLGRIRKDNGVRHVLAGDFNVDNRSGPRATTGVSDTTRHVRNTSRVPVTKTGPNSTRDVLNNHDLKFHIESETHRKGAAIDNFVTNFKPKKSRVIQSKSSQISDHHPIEIVISEGDVFKSTVETSLRKIFRKIFQKDSKTENSPEADSERKRSMFYHIFGNLFPSKPTDEGEDDKRPSSKVDKQKIRTSTPLSQEVPSDKESITYYRKAVQYILSYFRNTTDGNETLESRHIHGKRQNEHLVPEQGLREFIKSNCVFCKVVDFSFAVLNFFRNSIFNIREIVFSLV